MSIATSTKLHIDFISMMFALAVARVGIEIGDFYNKGYSIHDHLYVGAHLFLAIYIIASSWISWRNSISLIESKLSSTNLNFSFIILLLDLFLVIFYFILAKGVEKATPTEFKADGKTEWLWSLVIFGTYIIWDFITKLSYNEHGLKFDKKRYLLRGYQAVICFLIVLLLKDLTTSNLTIVVLFLDFGLLCTFILFRGLKKEAIYRFKSKADGVRFFVYIFIPALGIFDVFLIYFYHA